MPGGCGVFEENVREARGELHEFEWSWEMDALTMSARIKGEGGRRFYVYCIPLLSPSTPDKKAHV